MRPTATLMTVLLLLSACSINPSTESLTDQEVSTTTTVLDETDQRAAWCNEPDSADSIVETIETLKVRGHGSVTAAVRKISIETAAMSDDAKEEERSALTIEYLTTDWKTKHTGEWANVCRTAYENR